VTASGKRPALQRRLLLVLALLALLALALNGPAWWSRYQDERMQKMGVTELEALVKAQPKNTEALYRLGVAYARDNRYHEATATLLNVLDREPVRPDVLNDLGVTYLMQERYYEALVALNGALTARPGYGAAYANLGRLHLATKMPFTAAGDLERAVKSDPSDASAFCDLGEAYQQTLNIQSAKRAYESALRLNPRYVPAYVGLGKTEYSLTQYAEAEQTLQHALDLAPEDAQTLLTLARLHLERASDDAALQEVQQLLDRAARADPGNPDVWYDQGRVALRRGKATEAVDFLTKALRLSPAHNAALHQLERALRAAGRSADADRTGKVFEERSLREREETHLEEVVAHNPQDWDSQARLAEIYIQSGKRGLALLVCRRIQEGAPHHPDLPKLQQDLNRQFSPTPLILSGTKGSE
jgi:protein O-GlcNAc transferase